MYWPELHSGEDSVKSLALIHVPDKERGFARRRALEHAGVTKRPATPNDACAHGPLEERVGGFDGTHLCKLYRGGDLYGFLLFFVRILAAAGKGHG